MVTNPSLRSKTIRLDGCLAKEMIEVSAGVGEVVGLQSELLHESDVEVSEEWGIFGFFVDGEVLAMLEAAAGDKGREVAVGVSTGVAHS